MVVERARQAQPATQVSVTSKGPVRVERGTTMAVRVRIDDLTVKDREGTVYWDGDMGNAQFAVSVPANTAEGAKHGLASIRIDGLEIARVRFMILVSKHTGAVEEVSQRQERHRSAFASYASEDRDTVINCIHGMQKANPFLDIRMDVLSLRSGQYWADELLRMIPQCDVFYLFWSRHAAKSEWVEKEWRCALSTRGLDFIDPFPLESPDVVPPPSELSRKQFNDWVLSFRSR